MEKNCAEMQTIRDWEMKKGAELHKHMMVQKKNMKNINLIMVNIELDQPKIVVFIDSPFHSLQQNDF